MRTLSFFTSLLVVVALGAASVDAANGQLRTRVRECEGNLKDVRKTHVKLRNALKRALKGSKAAG